MTHSSDVDFVQKRCSCSVSLFSCTIFVIFNNFIHTNCICLQIFLLHYAAWIFIWNFLICILNKYIIHEYTLSFIFFAKINVSKNIYSPKTSGSFRKVNAVNCFLGFHKTMSENHLFFWIFFIICFNLYIFYCNKKRLKFFW